MTSKALSQNGFIYPDPHPDESTDANASQCRRPTVYDAVAGRISVAGFIPKESVISSTRDTVSSSTKPVPPEAVLFRSKNAPTRYAEHDIYFANERDDVILPDSDLLKAIHSYTSDFYSHAVPDGGELDFKSFDETALMAFGILVEEQMREALGKTGDLIFTEGAQPREVFIESQSGLSQRPSKRQRIDQQGISRPPPPFDD